LPVWFFLATSPLQKALSDWPPCFVPRWSSHVINCLVSSPTTKKRHSSKRATTSVNAQDMIRTRRSVIALVSYCFYRS
jgi:hypothetical protein